MIDAKTMKRKKTAIYKQTVEHMKSLGTYKIEFDAPVARYSELRVQFDVLTGQWYEKGCEITEDYTNKSGATNQRKTSLYLALEALRKELVDMENIFGLTPKGLKAIKAKGLDKAKVSALDHALRGMDEGT